MVLRTTAVVAAGPDNVDVGMGAGIFITVKDTDTGTKTTPTGTVTVTGSNVSGGTAFFTYTKTLDALGKVYTYAVDGPNDTHWPLSDFDANGQIPRNDGSYATVPVNNPKYPGEVTSGRRSSNFAAWFITVAYGGDALHAASSVEIKVNMRQFGEGV